MKKRQIVLKENYAIIKLTKGYEALIDLDDIHLISSFSWRAMVYKNTVYAASSIKCANGKQKTIRLHRVIMNANFGIEVDHISGNGLDNRRKNLRFATRSQNQHNQRKSSINSSGYKGVSWSASSKKWCANIRINDRLKYLGVFETAYLAHEAYIKASKLFHGDFGRIE